MDTQKRVIASLGVMVLAMTTVLSPAYANHGGQHSGGDLEGKFFKKLYLIEKNQAEIGIADDKLQALKNLSVETKKVLIKYDADIEVVGLDLNQKLYENPIDVAATNKLVDQKYELKKAKTKSLVEAFAKLKSTLSKEQLTKLKEIHKSKKESHEKMGR